MLARLWPADGPDRARLAQIHAWLAPLALLEFVPVPLADARGQTVVERAGRLWQVEPWRPGQAEPPGSPHAERLRAGVLALAAVHQRLSPQAVVGPSPGLNARRAELHWWLSAGFERLEQALGRARVRDETVLVRRWIALARPRAAAMHASLRGPASRPTRLQPVLRDVRRDHLLFEGDRLTGLVDAGAMDVEHPAADLARLLTDWPVTDPALRGQALAAYANGAPIDTEFSALLLSFERSATLLIGGHWARWLLLEPRGFDTPDAIRDGLERGLAGLERLVQSGG